MSVDQWGGQIMPAVRSCLSGYRCALGASGEALLWKVRQWEQNEYHLHFKFRCPQTALLWLCHKTLQREGSSCDGVCLQVCVTKCLQVCVSKCHRRIRIIALFIQTCLSNFSICLFVK
jgi:hypothetical protein